MSFSNRIIQLRTDMGMSQNQLAKLMNVSRQAVSKWENGLSTPDPAKMLLLAEVLNTDLGYLTTGEHQIQTEVVEKIVEVPVEVPVVQYVDHVTVKRVVRKQYRRHPVEYVLMVLLGMIIGFLIGWIL